jgi:hypothetical protein
MDPFKICPKCAHAWNTRDDFLKDLSICLVGFQSSFNETEAGYYLFNHELGVNQCNTTLAVEVEAFLSLHKGTMFTDIKFESQVCEEHCKRVEDLSQCPVECKNAVSRDIMQALSKCRN